MSNTKYKPRPYFNAVVGEELYNEDVEAATQKDKQKTDDDDDDQNSAESDTHNRGNKATSDEETYEKRWKDLKKHYDTEVSKLRGTIKELQDSTTPSFVPPKTAEDLEAFRKSNPEFYDVMLSVAHQQTSQSGEQVAEMRRKMDELEQEKAFVQIEKAHGDYKEVVKNPEFSKWLEVQDSTIQSWVKDNHNNANAFIRALDLFKLDAGITKQTPKRKSAETSLDTSAAQDVSVSGGSVQVGETNKRIWSRAEIDRMTPENFEKNEEEIMAAMMEGRVR